MKSAAPIRSEAISSSSKAFTQSFLSSSVTSPSPLTSPGIKSEFVITKGSSKETFSITYGIYPMPESSTVNVSSARTVFVTVKVGIDSLSL